MKTSATYSADGRQVIESTDVMGGKTSYQYGENGLVTKVTDPRNVVTGYTYDSMNRTTKVESGTLTQGENGSQPTFTAENTVEYTYDKDLLKNILVDEGILRYTFDYDVFGRKTAVYVGGAAQQRTLATYTYTDRLLTRQTYGNGTNFIDFEYDGLDRLTKKTYNGDATKYVKYLYDPNGNQYGIQDNIWGRNTYFEYDLAGRVNGVGVYDTDGTMRAYQSVRYNDGKGTVESMSSIMFSAAGGKLRSVDYAFTYGDPAEGEIPDTLYKYVVNSGEYTFAYDNLARLEGRTLVYGTNTKTESYTYKDSNLEGYTTTLVDTMTDFAGKAHSYTYDANGNILSETFDNYTVTYEYDHLNRMTRYNNPSLGSSYVYAYDDRGNITSVNMYEYSAGDLGEATYVIDYGYTDPSWPDLMTSYYGTDIVYDDLGNPQNWVWGETLTWENGRQLAKYESDGKTVNYTYNADGLRTSKSGDRTTEYFIVDGQYIGEVTKVGYMTYNVAYLYDENGSPAGLNVNGQEFFFVKNIQGDVLGLLNSRGTLSVTYRYDAYGNTISMKDSSGNEITNPQAIANVNPFRYRGYMYDIESGFYYLRSRYYDPSVGRFLNADSFVSTGQGFDGNNVFVYCGNNPIVRIDINGCSWENLISGLLHKGNEFFLSEGIDTAAIGAFFLMMKPDDNGVYHTNFYCWQMIPGYNDFYDYAFDLGTSMVAAQFSFSYNGCGYTIWAWKGDYINLGVGAELGIYRGSSGHRTVDTNLAMSMAMIVSYKNERIICHFPDEHQWWITGFYPNCQNADATYISVRIGIGFDDLGLYYAFKYEWGKDPRWGFFDPTGLAVLEF